MKVAYFDCGYGASGDMLLGALLAAGLPKDKWLSELEKIALPPDSFKIKIDQVSRCSLAATKVDVLIDEDNSHVEKVEVHAAAHKHDHEHSHSHARDGHSHQHGHSHEQGNEHTHDHAHDHPHDHDHGHDHDNHAHGRNLPDILKIIAESTIAPEAKSLAAKIFTCLGEAEAKVHGTTVEHVHFHEVGAVDSIVDIIGFAVGYCLLEIEESVVSPVPVGSGYVNCAHGLFPVPGPAVLNLLADGKLTVKESPFAHECLTPTGAAILSVTTKRCGPMPSMQVRSTGYGAGTFNPAEFPNVCRMIVGDSLN